MKVQRKKYVNGRCVRETEPHGMEKNEYRINYKNDIIKKKIHDQIPFYIHSQPVN